MRELFSDTGRGLRGEDVLKIEGDVGFTFPSDFVEYLKEINGGSVRDSADFAFGDEQGVTGARILFGFDEDPDWNISEIRNSADYIPGCLLPIGDDLAGSDKFVMDLRPGYAGEIYIRAINSPLNERPFLPEDLFDSPEQRLLYHRVARSFSEFLRKIAGDHRHL